MTAPAPDLIGAEPGGLTILRPIDTRRVTTKAYSLASNGKVVRQEFSEAKTYRAEPVNVEDLAGLHRLLLRLEGDPNALVIRGAPKASTDLTRTARTVRKGGGAFADVPRAWFQLDADKIPLPAGASVLTEPEDVAQHLVELFAGFAPDLEGASCIVQFSSSAGVSEMAAAEAAAGMPDRWGDLAKGDTVSAHLWFWLAEPQGGDALDRWAKAVNARIGHKAVDPATLRTVQPHYVAAPIFGAGLRDPLAGRRTLLIRGDVEAVSLDIPAEAPRPVVQEGEARNVAGLGFAARLALIGDPLEGFNGPIMGAIASYIASNWPNPDVDALVATLQARIHAADPGKRSRAEIDRYASREWLLGKVEWTMDRQREKAEAERAARAAAEAVPPTFPDRSVSLIEAHHQARDVVARFAQQLRAGEKPDLLLRMTVGGGKSEAAVSGAADILAAAREGTADDTDLGDGALFFLVPRHDLGGELVERIAQAHPGLRVATWRGMDADDLESPGQAMCRDPELPRAATAAGLSATVACSVCPLRDACGYRRQRSQRGDVWIAAHNLAFQTKPKALPDAAVVVMDEAFWQAAMRGVDGQPVQLAVSALQDTRTGTHARADRERLLYLRDKAARVLAGHEAGGLLRDAFEGAGFTADMAKEWEGLEWDLKPRKLDLADAVDRDAILAALKDAREQTGFSRLRPTLARYVRELLAGDAARSINATFEPEAELGRGQGTGPAVRFAWREDFAEWCRGKPKLFLDATTHPEVVRVWSPAVEVADIEIAAPGQHVRQIADREFGRSTFTGNPANIGRLADLVLLEQAQAEGGDVLLIAQEAVESALRDEIQRRLGDIPATLHIAHHGAVTGLNKWAQVRRLLVVGRPAMNRISGERLAELVKGTPVETEQAGDLARWPAVQGGIRRPDGTGTAVEHPRHPDSLVEALRWSITEGAVLQAIGRGRGVRREADPVVVTLLGNLPLPLTVAEVLSWDEVQPDRLTTAAAEAAIAGSALPLAPGDLAAIQPARWGSETAAKRSLEVLKGPLPLWGDTYKGIGPFRTLTTARYRKEGSRRLSLALVPIEGGREALEALLGPLADYQPSTTPEAAGSPPVPAEAPAASTPRKTPPPHPAPALEAPARIFVMGEAPPFSWPLQAEPPSVPSITQKAMLENLAKRLEAVRPPRLWGDITDALRIEAWHERCAAARAKWGEDLPDLATGTA